MQYQNREVFQKTVQAVVATYCQDGVLNHIDGKSLPSRDRIVRIFDALRQLLFPGFVGTQGVTRQNENFHVGGLLDAIEGMLSDEVFKAAARANDKPESAARRRAGRRLLRSPQYSSVNCPSCASSWRKMFEPHSKGIPQRPAPKRW